MQQICAAPGLSVRSHVLARERKAPVGMRLWPVSTLNAREVRHLRHHLS